MRTLMLGFLTLITLGAGMEAAAQTPEERTALRNVAVKHGDAVVRVLATRKTRQTINGREQSRDQAVQTNATVLDGTGLAVAGLSEFEAPDGLTAALQASAPPGTTISMSTETTDLKMHLADGREVPAKIVLRDADLDLMFIRPAEPLSSVPVVDAAAGKPAILDPLIVVQRTSEATGWRMFPGLVHLQIIVDKPRTFYVVPTVGLNGAGIGAPVFDAGGKFVGVLVRIAGTRTNPLPGILPADDVREIAKQAAGK